jgi:CSLREA domain-containing protein
MFPRDLSESVPLEGNQGGKIMKKLSITFTILFLLATGTFSMTAAAQPIALLEAAGSYVVNSTADTSDGACDAANCTLREAIEAANLAPGADEITFSISGTIILSGTLPEITDPAGLTIRGPQAGLTISGDNAYRILVVDGSAALGLVKLTLAKGFVDGYGGAVYNLGHLTADRCTFQDNQATHGGAIFDQGFSVPSVITASTFKNNSATVSGGAIQHLTGGEMITNSTFSGNSAPDGAAIVNGSGWVLRIINSTIAGNSATGTGGVSLNNISGVIYLQNTIVADPALGKSCEGRIDNEGNNIDSGSSCGWGSTNGSFSNTDPLLWSLADNGGPTLTFGLLSGSPAIDGVTFNAPNGSPAIDQRGINRPQGPRHDIGALEVELEYYRTCLPLVVR